MGLCLGTDVWTTGWSTAGDYAADSGEVNVKKEKLHAELKRLQTKLAVWCVLTICFYIIAAFNVLPFVHWLAWLSAGYCVFLLGTWLWLFNVYHHTK